MKKIILIFFILWADSSGAFAQTNSGSAIKIIPAAFKSDGCSMFPDGNYLDCCVAHDNAYYLGGSWAKRWQIDKQLFKCVAGKPGWHHKIIASLMWTGVRFGGVSWLPTSFRWGFGQNYISRQKHKETTKKILRKNQKINRKFARRNSVFASCSSK